MYYRTILGYKYLLIHLFVLPIISIFAAKLNVSYIETALASFSNRT